jgi:hypothetical protein
VLVCVLHGGESGGAADLQRDDKGRHGGQRAAAGEACLGKEGGRAGRGGAQYSCRALAGARGGVGEVQGRWSGCTGRENSSNFGGYRQVGAEQGSQSDSHECGRRLKGNG